MKIEHVNYKAGLREPFPGVRSRPGFCDYSAFYCTGTLDIRVRGMPDHWDRTFIQLAERILAECPRDTWTYVRVLDVEDAEDAYVYNDELFPINQARMMCRNCELAFMSHANGRCLWEATEFLPTRLNLRAYSIEVINLRTKERRAFWAR